MEIRIPINIVKAIAFENSEFWFPKTMTGINPIIVVPEFNKIGQTNQRNTNSLLLKPMVSAGISLHLSPNKEILSMDNPSKTIRPK